MANDYHRTPKWLIDFVKQWKPIALDPCATRDSSHWYARVNCTEKQDGLSWNWSSLTFCNPPYSRGQLQRWIAKAITEDLCRVESILLVPCDTSTKWWQSAMCPGRAWCALNKRVHFEGEANGSPKFASALIYYGDDSGSFVRHFLEIGQCHRSV